MARIAFRAGLSVVAVAVALTAGFVYVLPAGGVTPAATPVASQIPSTFTNLQILPADSSQRQVVGSMRQFASGLGVRCDHCHVGGDPNTLEGFDFASDEKETKTVARAMMRMVNEINGTFLPATGRSSEDLLRVSCATCHHGATRPQTLGQVLTEVVEEDGAEAAVARYRELREEYYGRAVYDFGRGTLTGLSESVNASVGPEAAVQLMNLNIEFFPDWGYNYFMLGQFQAAAGDREPAIASLRTAIELEPDNDWYKDALSRIRGR